MPDDGSTVGTQGDARLYAELVKTGFEGPAYDRFETELVRYAMTVMDHWLRSGRIFPLLAARGYGLTPTNAERDELRTSEDCRSELTAMAISRALVRFRVDGQAGRGWRPEGGASLKTYFVGGCLQAFPNEFRTYHRTQPPLPLSSEHDPLEFVPDAATNLAEAVNGELWVHEVLHRLPNRAREILLMKLDGYSHMEISEELGYSSPRAVEGVLRRLRQKYRTEDLNGGDHDDR